MRSLLLASAAFILYSGAALAQTATTSPAPTGAANAPSMAAPGMSPGNAGSTTPPMMAPKPSDTAANQTPAPTGAPQAAQTTSPGMSPGNMAPAPQKTASDNMGSMGADNGAAEKTTHTYHTYHTASMAMPADASAGQYLHIAKMAIAHHDKMTADEALSRAETRLLDRAVPAGDIASDQSPAITSIEHARMAINSGDMGQAKSDTTMAIQQEHGGMGSGMGGM
jgi:hypothetical protein